MDGKLEGVGSQATLIGQSLNCGSSVSAFLHGSTMLSGTPGFLEQVEVDTAHFMGNFPESCVLEGKAEDDDGWTEILTRTKLGPHRQHYFQLENTSARFTHVKLTIFPDGGVKRVRVLGRRESAGINLPSTWGVSPAVDVRSDSEVPWTGGSMRIPILPLTPEAFASFGKVIQAYEHNATPKGVRITSANAGTAAKFHKLAVLDARYPASAPKATTGLSVYRCSPVEMDKALTLTVLERHSFTTQAFIPMTNNPSTYLVVVALNGEDDQPNLRTARGFHATSSQGIMYNLGVWRTFIHFDKFRPHVLTATTADQPMTILSQV